MNLMTTDNDPIRKFQADTQEVIDRAESLRPTVRACNDAIERSGCSASVSIDNTLSKMPRVMIMMPVKSLDETVPLFRELAKEGLKTNKKDSHKDHSLFGSIGMREYDLGPHLIVMAMLIGSHTDETSGTTCRMEQVGVKEVPVYEMKCD